MSADVTGAGERMFAPFFDPVDMVGVFPADLPLGELRLQVSGEGLRFPLHADETSTLEAHLQAMEYASGSARFGPFCDNILGMNWRLPDGRLVRVGEQVVKSTTGYDLQRFLLHMGAEAGRAEQIVVRLRPAGTATVEGVFRADAEVLERLGRRLRASVWSHWVDAADLCLENGLWRLEISANGLAGEEDLYLRFFASLADDNRCHFEPVARPAWEGLPGYCVKCLPGEALRIAREQVARHGGRARILLFNGYIHFWPEIDPGAESMTALQESVAPQGGHVFGRMGLRPHGPREADWMSRVLLLWRER